MLQINSWVKLILHTLYDGILIIDRQGIVIYINPSYTRITKVEEKDILGKELKLIRPGSHLTDIIKSGKTEIGALRKENDIEYIVNMVPIIENGIVLGGVSVVNEINDVYKLNEKLSSSNKLISNLSQHISNSNEGKFCFDDIISEDIHSQKLKTIAKKISHTDSNILILGENGTGKKLYASAIHNESKRKNYPFIKLRSSTLEKEFFEKNNSLLQLGQKGTIFFDEISELEYYSQGKLLQFLEDNPYLRLICSTSKNLDSLVSQCKFREDLYYRISIIPMEVLPLRKRSQDIPKLIQYFIKKFNKKHSTTISISPAAITILMKYSWPGNVRELHNTLEFMFYMCDSPNIDIHDIPNIICKKSNIETKILPLQEKLKQVEKEYITELLEEYGNSVETKKQIATALQISLATLYNKLNT